MKFEKKLSIKQQEGSSHKDKEIAVGRTLRNRVMEIENGKSLLIQAPKIRGDSPLHKRLHETQPVTDTTHEVADFAPARNEILNAFSIPNDDDHVTVLSGDIDNYPDGTQRDFRAFSILINKETGDRFYAEGRTAHVELNKEILLLFNKISGESLTIKDMPDQVNNRDRWITTKGFVSDDEAFAEIEENFRKRTKSFAFQAEDGSVQYTPENWFISGSSLSS